MQINGTTLTKRQKALVRVALTREHARINDLTTPDNKQDQ